MKTKAQKIARILAMLFAYFILVGGELTCDPPPGPSDVFEVWFGRNDYEFISNEWGFESIDVTYHFAQAPGSGQTISLEIWDNVGNLATVGSFTLDVAAGQQKTTKFSWTGQQLGKPGGRILPIPRYPYTTLRATATTVNGSKVSPDASLTIRVNTYDLDGDGISDAVEDENNKLTGVGQTSITLHDGTTQTGLFVVNDLFAPPLIPTTGTLAVQRLESNRGTHDFSIASNTIDLPPEK